jgi:hypothetical protein
MEITHPRLGIFLLSTLLLFKHLHLANGSRKGHSPNYYSYNITTGLAWFFNLCETASMGLLEQSN